MKFDYLVKHNGVYYKAGEDVPMEDKPSVGASIPKKDKEPIEEVVKAEEKVVIEEPVEETSKAYTKTEINRLSTADLKSLAKENGIEGDYSGQELKKILIDKLV